VRTYDRQYRTKYPDRREERWAGTSIHGATKRRIAGMFAEERPVRHHPLLRGNPGDAQHKRLRALWRRCVGPVDRPVGAAVCEARSVVNSHRSGSAITTTALSPPHTICAGAGSNAVFRAAAGLEPVLIAPLTSIRPKTTAQRS